jgi:hypothetical protein
LLVAIAFNTGSSRTLTYPAGFTSRFSSVTSANSLYIGTKVADNEPASYTFTWSGANNNVVSMLVFRNADTSNFRIGSITRATPDAEDYNITASSISPVSPGILLAIFAEEYADTLTGVTAPSGMTSTTSYVSTNNSPRFWVYRQTQSAGSTGSRVLAVNNEDSTDDDPTAAILFQVYGA